MKIIFFFRLILDLYYVCPKICLFITIANMEGRLEGIYFHVYYLFFSYESICVYIDFFYLSISYFLSNYLSIFYLSVYKFNYFQMELSNILKLFRLDGTEGLYPHTLVPQIKVYIFLSIYNVFIYLSPYIYIYIHISSHVSK